MQARARPPVPVPSAPHGPALLCGNLCPPSVPTGCHPPVPALLKARRLSFPPSELCPVPAAFGGVNERTFVAIKPDGVQRRLVGEIIRRFERKGLQLVGMKLLQVSGWVCPGWGSLGLRSPQFPRLCPVTAGVCGCTACWCHCSTKSWQLRGESALGGVIPAVESTAFGCVCIPGLSLRAGSWKLLYL